MFLLICKVSYKKVGKKMGWATLERNRINVFLGISRLQAIISNIMSKKLDLHKYSTSVGRGFITPLAMAGMPKYCEPLAAGFALAGCEINNKALEKAASIWGNHYGNASSGLTAAQASADFKSVVGTMLENQVSYEETLKNKFPDEAIRNKEYMKHQYMLQMFQEAQKEEQKECAKLERDKIKEIEDELDIEKQYYQTKLSALEKEHDALKSAVAAAQEREKSQYTSQGR